MTLPQAAQLAVKVMRAEVNRLAFDANLAERLGAAIPEAVKAAKERRRFRR
jgi:hypothetical protein